MAPSVHMKGKNKNLLKIDLVLIIGSLATLVFLVGYVNPLVIAPLDNYETSERDILFSIEKAENLIIDDNIDFTTPDEYKIKDGLKISLEPGKYYWKVTGILNSNVKILTIKSEVNLELRKIDDENYGVVNAGNVQLNVDIYNGTEMIDNVRLKVDEEMESQGVKFIGEMG